MKDDAKLAPAVAWDMGSPSRRWRFLLTENWLVIGYYKNKAWLYTTYECVDAARAHAIAIEVMENEERRGATLRREPRWDSAQLTRSWMDVQSDLYRQPSDNFDIIFRRALGSSLVLS